MLLLLQEKENKTKDRSPIEEPRIYQELIGERSDLRFEGGKPVFVKRDMGVYRSDF
jgi:hypothetical protein